MVEESQKAQIKKKKNKFKDVTQISKKADIFLNIVMGLLALGCIYPLVLVLSISLTSESTVAVEGYKLIPSEVTLKAYEFVFTQSGDIFRAYGVTIFVTVVGSIVSLAVISLYAYPLSRKDFKHKTFFTMIVFFTMLFNAGLVPWYMVYTNVLHIKNTVFALMLPGLMTPLYVLIMRTFYRTTIPEGIIEAAKIDGASEFRIFTRIVLPLSKPSLATIGLFNVLYYWNDWYAPLLFITDEKLYNLQYMLYRINQSITYLTSQTNSLGNVTELLANMPTQTGRMAMAIIAIGPIILAYPFFQKYFVAGLTVGSLKG